MPKVEKHTFIHQKTNSEITTDVYFGKMRKHQNYNLRENKVFYIELSKEAERHHGFTHVYADTFKEVTKKWEDAMIEFMEAVRSFRKVIAISVSSIMFEELAISLNAKSDVKNYKNNIYGRPRLKAEAYPTSRLDLSYHVGYIVMVGEKKFWSYYTDEEIERLHYCYSFDSLDDDKYHYRDTNFDGYKFIEWTEEREQWIKNMYESFNKVIAQCVKFYNQDEKIISLIMDSKANLLTMKQ